MAQLQLQCPNPKCGSTRIATNTFSIVAEPGKGAFSRLLSRIPFPERAASGRLLFSAIMLDALAFIVLLLARTSALQVFGYLVLTLFTFILSLQLLNFYFRRRYPPAERLTYTQYRCRQCRYTWLNSDSPRDLVMRRLEADLTEYRKRGNKRRVAAMLSDLGAYTINHKGDPQGATRLLEESLAIRRELHDPKIRYTLNNLGFALFFLGQLDRARELCEEALVLFRHYKDWYGMAHTFNSLGLILLEQGNLEKARTSLEGGLLFSSKMGLTDSTAGSLEVLTALAQREGQPGRAARLLGAASALRETANKPLMEAARLMRDRTLGEARSSLGEAEFSAAWAQGRIITIDHLIRYALDRGGDYTFSIPD